jgi:L-arabinose isomerase
MTRKPRAALLPCYLALYDELRPEMRDAFRPFLDAIAGGFEREGVEVVEGPICRVRDEFEQAVRGFEEAGADLLVTVHIAYSPSLESAETLARTPLPLLMLDTTMDYDFGPGVAYERRMYNHGVHGVQDLASVLRRMGRAYHIVAGHVTESDVLRRAAGIARGAYAAAQLRNTKALRLGPPFDGMGDFAVDEAVMRDALGIAVDTRGLDALVEATRAVTDADVDAECARDRDRYAVEAPDDVLRRSVRVGLGLRRMLEAGPYGGFSMNFRIFDTKEPPVNTLPFLEASKAMGRGVGFAGEGDVLTAAMVGAVARAFGRTSFVEVFCADWKGGSLYLSHMGEVSPSIAAETPRVLEMDYGLSDAENPAVLVCAPAIGPAVLVNLAPGPDDSFRLLLAPVDVLEDSTDPTMRDGVRGWIRPRMPLEPFLEQYSLAGGTHHSALVLGDHVEGLRAFASTAGLEPFVLG